VRGVRGVRVAAMWAEEVWAPLGPRSQHSARTSGRRVTRDGGRLPSLPSSLPSLPPFPLHFLPSLLPPFFPSIILFLPPSLPSLPLFLLPLLPSSLHFLSSVVLLLPPFIPCSFHFLSSYLLPFLPPFLPLSLFQSSFKRFLFSPRRPPSNTEPPVPAGSPPPGEVSLPPSHRPSPREHPAALVCVISLSVNLLSVTMAPESGAAARLRRL